MSEENEEGFTPTPLEDRPSIPKKATGKSLTERILDKFVESDLLMLK